MPITLESEAVRRLADIGFLGISRGRFAEAEEVFGALALVRPGEEVGPVGLAIARLGKGDPVGARDALRGAPQTDSVLAFTCVALARSGERETAADIHEELEGRAPGSPLAQIARAALDGAGAAQTAGMTP